MNKSDCLECDGEGNVWNNADPTSGQRLDCENCKDATYSKTVPSYAISIFMAGDVSCAVDICREYCDAEGYCVTVTPTTYVYTCGQEEGFVVGLINYPRFPSTPDEMLKTALEIANKLRAHLYQDSYSIQTPTETHWFSWRAHHAIVGEQENDDG